MIDPMVPLLTGWLAGLMVREAGDYMKMKIVDVQAETLDCFVVEFASGLRLRVKVAVDATPPVA